MGGQLSDSADDADMNYSTNIGLSFQHELFIQTHMRKFEWENEHVQTNA